jgi:hypothetical protein
MSTFEGMTIKVVRFDQEYPKDAPDSFVIGFTVTSNSNGRSTYQDTRLLYTEVSGKSDQEIVGMAWERLTPAFTSFAESVASKPAVIGSVFNP